jgi:hypothetical protein
MNNEIIMLILGVALSSLGFIGKSIIDYWTRKRERQIEWKNQEEQRQIEWKHQEYHIKFGKNGMAQNYAEEKILPFIDKL